VRILRAIGGAWAAILLAACVIVAHTPLGNAQASILPTICHPNGGCVAGESFTKAAYVLGKAQGFDLYKRGTVRMGWPFSKTRADRHFLGKRVIWIHQNALPAGNCMVPDTNEELFVESVNACGKNADVVESGHWLVDVEATDDTRGFVIQLISAGHAAGHLVWGYHESANQSTSWDY
jgi:hypothetical protein